MVEEMDERRMADGEPEEERIEDLPRQEGMPFVTEGATETIQFAFHGKLNEVEVLRASYGSARNIRAGIRVKVYQERAPDGSVRRVREPDLSSVDARMQELFDTRVKKINGVPWSRGHKVDQLDDEWVSTFLAAFMPDIGEALDSAKKKSWTP